MAQILKDEDVKTIEEKLVLLKSRYAELVNKLHQIGSVLKNEKAKEYLFHGVARRLGVIERCVVNIYSIFPLRREQLLEWDELKDVAINLHAFFVNIFGLLDNMAWVVVYERNRRKGINKKDVGLYKNTTQEILNDDFKQYLNSDRMKKWHDEYLKNYRDALAHRIPLYVPPKNLTPDQQNQVVDIEEKRNKAIKDRDVSLMDNLQKEEDSIGTPSPFFVHSLTETNNKVVSLHAQVITDFGTVEEILENYCKMFTE
jgi:hypothetical protein